jgi:2'-5' RNA ligase
LSSCWASNDLRCHLPEGDAGESWRLFVAAPLPEDAAAAVHDALAPLRDRFPAVRWMAPELLHLTLVFLGETEASRVPAITEAVKAVALRHAPFQLSTGEAGGRVDTRPNHRRGGVAWLNLATGGAETAALALDIDAALGTATYDARRAPHPHLTIARRVDAVALASLRDAAATLRITWRTDRVVLFRSHTGRAGSRYDEFATVALTHRK